MRRAEHLNGHGRKHPGGPRLIARIGAHQAHFALEIAPGRFEQAECFAGGAHADIHELGRAYLERLEGPAPIEGAMTLAASIDGDQVHPTHRGGAFSIDATRSAWGLQTLLAVNDPVAMAMALPHLNSDQRCQIGGGCARAGGMIGLIVGRSGLGMAALVPCAGRWIPLASEGGEASFSPANETQMAILRHAWKSWDPVLADRLLSASGLELMHEALQAEAGLSSSGPAPTADEIIRRGIEAVDPVCERVLTCFCEMLGTQAANLAVVLNATGGIYIGGRLAQALGEFLPRSGFRLAFERGGRHSGFVTSIPTYLILTDQCLLLGAAHLLGEHLDDQAASGQLLERIRSGMGSFTPAERRVASLVLGQARAVLKQPVAGIAARAKVSQPTVIRFCRSLGLQGLSDFKLKLASGLSAAVPVAPSRVRVDDDIGELVGKVLANTGEAITRLHEDLDSRALERAIDLLAKAHRVEFYAAASEGLLALDAQHQFLSLGISANAYPNAQLQSIAAGMLGEGDVAVVISRSGDQTEILEAAHTGLKAGAGVIAIAAANSSLALCACVVLDLGRQAWEGRMPVVSRIPPLVLIDILAVGVSMRRIKAAGRSDFPDIASKCE